MGKIIGIVLVLVLLIGGIGGTFLGRSFLGHGSGNGSGQVSEGSVSDSIPPQTNAPEEKKISEILIEGDKIYFDGEPCVDEYDLRQKITDIGTDREYNFKYDSAIKGTYDKVEQILNDLEKTLNIKVNWS